MGSEIEGDADLDLIEGNVALNTVEAERCAFDDGNVFSLDTPAVLVVDEDARTKEVKVNLWFRLFLVLSLSLPFGAFASSNRWRSWLRGVRMPDDDRRANEVVRVPAVLVYVRVDCARPRQVPAAS